MASEDRPFKRIIACCDGTWMDSLGEKGGVPPSNVTRISRVIKRKCHDGTPQIIMYDPGVGSGATRFDQFTGGVFGMGLDQNIREVYNFLCTNYVAGDDTILIGFSRGAFTARSVADMVASCGLLTPSGLELFYRIFDDYEHMGDPRRAQSEFLCPEVLTPYDGQKDEAKIRWEDERKTQYFDWLKEKRYTRDSYGRGGRSGEITIKAIGVWDTVGTLGIPPAPVLGIQGSADQWKFTNTEVSGKVENAFQALALDEPRYAFRPALWEKLDESTTNLKQVWFPGSHANVGGGWHDQLTATIALAWMCDQLSSVGVEFSHRRMTDLYNDAFGYGAAHPFPFVASPWFSWATSWFKSTPSPLPWALADLFDFSAYMKRDELDCQCKEKHPTQDFWDTARSWGLGQIRHPPKGIQTWVGTTTRRPGLFMRQSPEDNEETDFPLENTQERIHSSVRVRLACHGLHTDDGRTYDCGSLVTDDNGRPLWRLQRGSGFPDGTPSETPLELEIGGREYPRDAIYDVHVQDSEWKWVHLGQTVGEGKQMVPQMKVMPEEPMTGYWERYLLKLSVGKKDVWRWAQDHPPTFLENA